MPELHKLMPPLGVLQDRGQKSGPGHGRTPVGRLRQGALAFHVTPEAARGGAIAKVRDGDMMRVDAVTGSVEVLVDAQEWARRTPAEADLSGNHHGVGRELFAPFRAAVGSADAGASIFADAYA